MTAEEAPTRHQHDDDGSNEAGKGGVSGEICQCARIATDALPTARDGGVRRRTVEGKLEGRVLLEQTRRTDGGGPAVVPDGESARSLRGERKRRVRLVPAVRVPSQLGRRAVDDSVGGADRVRVPVVATGAAGQVGRRGVQAGEIPGEGHGLRRRDLEERGGGLWRLGDGEAAGGGGLGDGQAGGGGSATGCLTGRVRDRVRVGV